MWLHVGVIGAEERLRAGDRQRFGDVDELAAAVVAPAWIPFGVLVGQHRAGCFEDGLADEVFRGDELEAFCLAARFVGDGSSDLRVGVGEGAGHKEFYSMLNAKCPRRNAQGAALSCLHFR